MAITVSVGDRHYSEAVIADLNTPQSRRDIAARARYRMMVSAPTPLCGKPGRRKRGLMLAGSLHGQGVDGLPMTTRTSGVSPLGVDMVERVVRLKLDDLPVKTTHRCQSPQCARPGIRASASAVHRFWKAHGAKSHRGQRFRAVDRPQICRDARTGPVRTFLAGPISVDHAPSSSGNTASRCPSCPCQAHLARGDGGHSPPPFSYGRNRRRKDPLFSCA